MVNNGTTTETTALLSSDQVKLSHSPLFTGSSITTKYSSNKQMTLQTSHNAASPVGNIGTTTEMTSLLSLDQVKSSHSSMFTGLSLTTKHSSRKQIEMSQLSQYAASFVVKPSPSLLSIGQSVTTRHSSNKPVTSHMSPSKLASGQSGSISSGLDKSKLITNTVPQQKTSSLIMKTLNPSTTLVTKFSKTSAESKSSVVMQANDYNSTSILPSPATQAVDNSTTNAIPSSSMFKVITSSLTSLPNPTLHSSSSKGNDIRGSSKQYSSTLTAAVSNVSSPHIASRTFVPSPFSVLKTTSLTPYSTLNRMKVNQTNTTNSVGNHPSSTVKVIRSISSAVFKHSSSAKPLLNTSSISTMTNTNTSLPSSVNATPSSRVELHITSTSSSLKNLSHVMNSAVSSIPIQSPSVFASSVISTYNQSLTAKTGRSCYDNNTLLTCVTLQPSAPIQFTTTTSRVIMSNSLSNSVSSTFSFNVPPTTKKGTGFIYLCWG